MSRRMRSQALVSMIVLFLCVLATASAVLLGNPQPARSQEAIYTPVFTSDNMLRIPEGKIWREWPFMGSLVTPNALNDGEAPFPEHHVVYIDPVSWEEYKKTGTFRDGTVLAKELNFVRAPDGTNENGSTDEVSGTGYFMGEYSGFEITIKSKALFPDEPGNWAYYSFSTPDHKTLATAAKAFPAESCNGCHAAAAADDWVFTQHYPVLRAGKGAGEKGTGGMRSDLSEEK